MAAGLGRRRRELSAGIRFIGFRAFLHLTDVQMKEKEDRQAAAGR
jgi:hypothetical protein